MVFTKLKNSIKILAVGGPLLLVGIAANAAHDDTTLRSLQVSISSISGGDVTIDVSGEGIDSYSLASAWLGTQALWNSQVGTWTPPAPPAIDWGDGNTVAATQIPFTGTNGTFFGYTLRTFASQFMHTYAAPGTYTISVFGSNVYAATSSEYSIASGTLSAVSPVFATATGSINNSGTAPIGILQRIQAVVGGAAATVEEVPALPALMLGLLAMLMATAGINKLRRA